MKNWLRALDRILRGELTQGAALKDGLAGVPLGGLTVLIIGLGAIYGMGTGSFALFKSTGASFAQFFASAIKLPALFLLTLVITLPSLYVFNALVGSRLGLGALLRLLIASQGVTLTVLASFAPIVAFFSVSTTSYPFMVLLNVMLCTVAGVLGLAFLRQTLQRLTVFGDEAPPPLPSAPAKPGALDPLDTQPIGRNVRSVFRCWMLLFALVGAQMAWVLRPFIGHPELPFTFFRAREANFFTAVVENFVNLFR